MKTKVTPIELPCDEDIIVDFQEMISLLMGKDFASRQAFRNDVLKRAAEIRNECSGRGKLRAMRPARISGSACLKS